MRFAYMYVLFLLSGCLPRLLRWLPAWLLGCSLSCFALLCFALLCFALLCFALLCFALLCLPVVSLAVVRNPQEDLF